MDEKQILDNVIEIYKNIIKDNCGQDALDDKNELLHSSNELDSLGIVEFIIEVEERYDVSLEEVLTDIRNATEVAELLNIVESVIDKAVRGI